MTTNSNYNNNNNIKESSTTTTTSLSPSSSYLTSSGKDEVHDFKFLRKDSDNYEIWRCSKYHIIGDFKHLGYHDILLWRGEFNDTIHNNKPYSGKFHCNNCSKSFSTDKERITHSYSHMQQQQD
jgi:hypothetical protein